MRLVVSLGLAFGLLPYMPWTTASSGTCTENENIDALMDRLEKDVLVYRDVVNALLSDPNDDTSCTWLSKCVKHNYEHCKSQFPSSTCLNSPFDNPVIKSTCYDSNKCQTKLDYTVSSIRLAASSFDETTSNETKMMIYESICKTVPLDTWFRQYYENASNDAMKPLAMHFGTQQGMHRMYPANYGEDVYPGKCKPYDPTIRPWYSGASSARRNLILMLDVTMNDGNRVKNMKNMVSRVIDASTIADNIAIITFNSTTSSLLDPDIDSTYGFHAATIRNKEGFNEQILNLVSDSLMQLPNYTLAFRDALSLLQDQSVACSTAIMLFTDEIKETMNTIEAFQPDLQNTETDANPILLFIYLMKVPDITMSNTFTCTGPSFSSGLWSYITDESDIVNGLAPYYEIFQTVLEQQQLNASSTRYSLETIDRTDYVAWSEPYSFFEFGEIGVTVSAPMYDRQGKLIGVVGIDYSLSGLNLTCGYENQTILDRARRQQDDTSCPSFRDLRLCAFRFDQRNIPNLLCSITSTQSPTLSPLLLSLPNVSSSNSTPDPPCVAVKTINTRQPSPCCNTNSDCTDITSSSKLWNNVAYEGENYTERGCCTSTESILDFMTSSSDYGQCLSLTDAKKSSQTGLIAGCVTGGVAVIIIIIGFLVYIKYYKKVPPNIVFPPSTQPNFQPNNQSKIPFEDE